MPIGKLHQISVGYISVRDLVAPFCMVYIIMRAAEEKQNSSTGVDRRSLLQVLSDFHSLQIRYRSFASKFNPEPASRREKTKGSHDHNLQSQKQLL